MGRLFVLLAVSTCAFAQAVDQAAIDRLVESSMKTWEVPGVAVAIVRGGEVVYMKGVGLATLGTRKPVTTNTLFAIASTSKAFTTAAMAMLVDEGRMDWDDPVRKHLPWFRLSDPLANEYVTMRDLVSHRTGLSRHDLLWIASPWSREEVIRKAGLVPLTKPYRSLYQYQNIMFTTAGEVVGRIGGTTWEDFIRKRIFEPLGMTGADFSTTVAEVAADHSTAHQKGKDGKLKAIKWRNVDNVGSAGSINAGIADMCRWLQFQMAGGVAGGRRLVSEKNLAETHTPQMVVRLEGTVRAMNPETNMIAYGLGWVIQDYRGRFLVSHGGSLPGFRSEVAMLPKEKIGMVILSNLGGTQMPASLRNTLTDYLLGLPPGGWDARLLAEMKRVEKEAKDKEAEREAKRHKDTRPSRELGAYAGIYEHEAYGKVTVSVEDGALILAWSGFRSRLHHFHFDTFVIRDENQLENNQVVFHLGADGGVESIGMLEVTFKRAKEKPAKS